MVASTDVFPPRDLPGRADDWGRKVEDRVRGAEQGVEALQQALGNQGRGQSGTNTTLARQLVDLTGRVGYADKSLDLLSWTTTQTANIGWGPTLTFTLNEPRVISATFAIEATLGGVANNGGTFDIAVSTGFLVNGASANGYEAIGAMNAMANWNVSTGFASRTNAGSVVSYFQTTLPAGTHTVQGRLVSRTVSITGSASASATIINPAIFVQVLQPAG